MRIKGFAIGTMLALTIFLASISVVEFTQVENLSEQLQSRTQGSTTVVTQTIIMSQDFPIYYYSQSISIPLPSIPTTFVLGDPKLGAGHAFGFNYTTELTSPCQCPPNATCTCTEYFYELSFKVYRWNEHPAQSEWANFSNGELHTSTITQGESTYPPLAPYPSSATLFGGNVTMQWLANLSPYYVNITVK